MLYCLPMLSRYVRISPGSPYTLSLVTQTNETLASWADRRIVNACSGFVWNGVSSRTQAFLRRSRSYVHSLGKYNARSVDHTVSLLAGICQKYSYLTIFHPSGCANELSFHSNRFFPCLRNLVSSTTQMLAHSVFIPGSTI